MHFQIPPGVKKHQKKVPSDIFIFSPFLGHFLNIAVNAQKMAKK
jgi:hypothetical protein